MISLTYLSTSTRHMIDDDLVKLMESCHRKNKAANITGMLLYNSMDTFIQVIEGEKETIESLFEVIKQDDRHQDVICLEKREIKRRDFPDWTMGFRNLRNIKPLDVEGFSDFMNSEFNDPTFDSLTFARQMLSKVKHSSMQIIY